MNNKDSVLKKEFKGSDVQRLRNLVNKKFGEGTKAQVGYDSDNTVLRKEGDIWNEGNKTWTIKNGIRRNVTKFEGFKKIISAPDFCPKCNKFMNYYMDKKVYLLHNQCLDCYSQFESELKRLGKFEEYEKNQVKNNVKAYISDLESKFQEYLNETMTFMSEQGDAESWQGDINKEQVTQEFNDYIASIKSQFDID